MELTQNTNAYYFKEWADENKGVKRPMSLLETWEELGAIAHISIDYISTQVLHVTIQDVTLAIMVKFHNGGEFEILSVDIQ